ncbi:nuclear transport factor 2 family protein [Actinoplanes bogorensis]|uniref:Nuclear transport factor 2 family protein n=2 Tax=Paractinoplanes bogorensis TaxID=1610840 RepID=A0ABS5YM10_9ACTN|nr:nuclear transport factor 2 family protein [Actinoplanes bogorensis]
MAYIADDIVCDAPAGRIEGAAAFRGFMAPFVGMLRGTSLLAAFGDETTALIMYDTETALVPSAPGAEHVTVAGGRITHSRFLFDRLPFERARH